MSAIERGARSGESPSLAPARSFAAGMTLAHGSLLDNGGAAPRVSDLNSGGVDMIIGYAGDFSVLAGNSIDLHFASSSGSARGRIHIYRWGVVQGAGAWIHVAADKAQTFTEFRRGSFSQAWGWPAYPFSIPATWKSGVYTAVVLSDRANGTTFKPESQPLWQVLFVVRNPSPGSAAHILYKVPFFTYAAYNGCWLQDPGMPWTSLYQDSVVDRATVFRPGIGVDPWDSDNTDFEDTKSNRQTFQHWDAKMAAWLEANGYAVDYCTDLDVHRDASLVSNYCLLLSVGHDEYWSEEMRHSVEAFIRKGGNVAFFSGNTCWWRLRVTETPGDLIIARLDNWPKDNLETRLTGVSYRHGAGRWDASRREPIGYTVQYAKHWVYAGTGLADGDEFAADERLVGYECDGTQLIDGVQPRTPTFADGTPSSFVVLGFATTPVWDDAPLDHRPTMGVYAENGIVFTAATTDWPRVLAAGQAEVTQITKNVLAKLTTRPLAITGPITFGACHPYVGLAGAEATFYVSNVAPGATIEWSTPAGTIVGKDDEPVVVIRLPNNSTELVTVWVSIDGGPCPGFGTLSFRPLSEREFRQSELFCHLGHMVVYSRPLRGSRDKVTRFVDPLWDPPLFDGGAPLDLPQLRMLKSESLRFLREVDRAIAIARPKRTSRFRGKESKESKKRKKSAKR
jgi:hypothetical protein